MIAFDIDGVVADTMEAFIRVARIEFGIKNLTKEQITSYWLEDCLSLDPEIVEAIVQRLLDDPLGVQLSPLPGARAALGTLASHGRLTFVTARPTREPIERWLGTLVPNAVSEDLRVIATGRHAAKAGVLRELGLSYFVEDHLDTCRELCEQGINAIVFDQPWNRDYTPFCRVDSWDEILDLIVQ
jgi:uncharacterized HAD superfamily protein